MTDITHPTQVSRRPSAQLIAEGVIATYINDISARRRRRPARFADLSQAPARLAARRVRQAPSSVGMTAQPASTATATVTLIVTPVPVGVGAT